jgi:hypothetical protein
MEQVTLNKNSWHFKYYSSIVSDTPPKSLCPYFWTMILLMVISPIMLLGFITIKISKLFNKIKPIATKKVETEEQRFARWEREDKKDRKRAIFWNKAGDYFVLILKYVFLPIILCLIVYYMYITGEKNGWLNLLMYFGIAILIALFFVGVILFFETYGNKIGGVIGKVLSFINPFNWKVTKICGEMIKAQYTKMCPLITWVGEDKKIKRD